MNDLDINNWSIANQQYLAGKIGLVKEQLRRFCENKTTDASLPDQQPANEELKKLSGSMPALPALDYLVKAFSLTDFERDVLLMCAGMELDAGFADLPSSAGTERLFLQPSFGLALAAFAEPHWSAIAPGAALRYWRLIEVNQTQTVTSAPIKIDEHILHYLAGIRGLNERLKEVLMPVDLIQDPVRSQLAVAALVLKAVSKEQEKMWLPIIHLNGSDRSDKLMVATCISRQLHSQLFIISGYAIPVNAKDNMELARLWSREAALNNYILFIDCMDFDNNDKQKAQAVISFIENIQGMVLLNSDQWMPHLNREKYIFHINKPSPGEQMALWKSVFDNHAGSQEAILEKIVSQFNLGAEEIQSIAAEILAEEAGQPNSIEKKLWKLCCRHTRPGIDELALRIEPVASWNDIVLPPSQKMILEEIAAQVKQRNKVYHTWGFGTKGTRGLGISVLFAGESGTGKTMAAEVLANELQLDLYRIDLSKVINKYIGETEKNLKKIFDEAEAGGAILLFDEADALFGKRSDVKDSHDRYSNIEVSYLLQRMEAYRGLAILTTNMKSSLDKAFMRRIRFIINFPFPDSMQRVEIWNKIFPEGVPREGIDAEGLSRLSVAGGSIRNIALNAAFLAADEDGPVQMSHIFRAAKSEYDKIEKPFNNIEIKQRQ